MSQVLQAQTCRPAFDVSAHGWRSGELGDMHRQPDLPSRAGEGARTSGRHAGGPDAANGRGPSLPRNGKAPSRHRASLAERLRPTVLVRKVVAAQGSAGIATDDGRLTLYKSLLQHSWAVRTTTLGKLWSLELHTGALQARSCMPFATQRVASRIFRPMSGLIGLIWPRRAKRRRRTRSSRAAPRPHLCRSLACTGVYVAQHNHCNTVNVRHRSPGREW